MELRNVILNSSLGGIINYFRDKRRLERTLRKRNEIISDYFQENTIYKLHIGCGPNVIEGWLNTDLFNKGDIAYLDAASTYPLDDKSIDYIFSEHVFEHLDLPQQLIMLKECYRIMKDDGLLRIATPSLDFIFDLYQNHKEIKYSEYTEWAVENTRLQPISKDVSYNQYYCYVINNFFKDWGHQIIHNFESLSELAKKVGFTNITSCGIGESTVEHLRNLERHGTVIPKEWNELETMVVEFKK